MLQPLEDSLEDTFFIRYCQVITTDEFNQFVCAEGCKFIMLHHLLKMSRKKIQM